MQPRASSSNKDDDAKARAVASYKQNPTVPSSPRTEGFKPPSSYVNNRQRHNETTKSNARATDGQERFPCQSCGKHFVTIGNLYRHRIYFHKAPENVYECRYCTYKSSFLRDIDQHMYYKHQRSGDRRYNPVESARAPIVKRNAEVTPSNIIKYPHPDPLECWAPAGRNLCKNVI